MPFPRPGSKNLALSYQGCPPLSFYPNLSLNHEKLIEFGLVTMPTTTLLGLEIKKTDLTQIILEDIPLLTPGLVSSLHQAALS